MKAIERLYEYLKIKGIKPTRLEKEIGLSNGYLGTQLKRKGNLGEDILIKIIDYCLDLSPIWLLTGKGSMIKEAPAVSAPEKEKDELLDRLKDKEKLIKVLEENKDLLEYKLQVLEKRVAELEQQNTPAVKTKGKATTV